MTSSCLSLRLTPAATLRISRGTPSSKRKKPTLQLRGGEGGRTGPREGDGVKGRVAQGETLARRSRCKQSLFSNK